jgi:hypothetical protein
MSWAALNAAIVEARHLVEIAAPDAATAAEGEAYVSRVVTAAMATAFMGHRLTQGGLATALPVHGGPNPDYIMRSAGIDPAGHYRLAGQLNGSERVGVGLYTIGRNGAPLIAGSNDGALAFAARTVQANAEIAAPNIAVRSL